MVRKNVLKIYFYAWNVLESTFFFSTSYILAILILRLLIKIYFRLFPTTSDYFYKNCATNTAYQPQLEQNLYKPLVGVRLPGIIFNTFNQHIIPFIVCVLHHEATFGQFTELDDIQVSRPVRILSS